MSSVPSIHELVTRCAERWPRADAVVWRDQVTSYAGLEARAAAIAEGLLSRGVKPGEPVGVCLPVGLDRVAAMLGAFKAGAAVVPLDAQWPQERFRYVFSNAGARWLLLESTRAAQAPAVGERWLLDEAAPGRSGAQGHPLPMPPADPERVAYIVYTSGSTGEPKGVRVPHRGLSNVAQTVARGSQLAVGDRVHQFTPIIFDAALEAIFAPLSSGAAVVLAEDVSVSPAEFTALVSTHRLTYLNLPPLFLKEWVSYLRALGQQVPAGVKWVCLGGDRVPTELWRAWAEVGGAQIPWANDYGPTEATITATRYEYRGEPLAQDHLPIGKPIPNVRAYVLGPDGREVPPGEVGELHVGGVGVAHGYVNQPEATAERFLPDPFASEPGARMYRTGDLVRQLGTGDLEYLGRIDDQVKISGYRIQLGEVEAALRGHPQLEACAVVAREDPSGYKRLVAYVVAPAGVGDAALREFAARKLPAYMMPSLFVRLSALPLTSNGKADRKALPAPSWVQAPAARGGESIEARVLALCAELLGVASVRADDDFFELGGQSLMAMQLLTRIEEDFGAAVPIATLFEEPRLGQLVARVVEQSSAAQVA